MAAIIFLSIMYIGNAPFKRDAYFGSRRTFARLTPQEVEVNIAQKMAYQCPDVYMITHDGMGMPTPEYIIFLMKHELVDKAENELKKAGIEKTVEEFLKDHNALADLPKNLTAAPGVVTRPEQVKQQQQLEAQQKVDAFENELRKASNKKVLQKMASNIGYQISENEHDRSEMEQIILAEYRKQMIGE